jgi:pyrroline-5-carboxylate reductase
MNIHIIGGGNLGCAIALGFAKYTNHTIIVTRRNVAFLENLKQHNITISNNNNYEIEKADVVILAIKPFQTKEILEEILPKISGKILASAVSGWSLEMLEEITKNSVKVIRIMPNIAIQYAESATCISFSEKNKEEGFVINELFQPLGTSINIDEKQMDAATVLGACGTAFALRYIRASMQAGIEIGFNAKTALEIASQTAKGAARMALEENTHPEQLIDRVTTPQGCTIVGLNEMEHQGFSAALIKGIKTSLQKIKE